MKKYITIATFLAAGSAFANAAMTYIDFDKTSTVIQDDVYGVANNATFSSSVELKASDGEFVANLTGFELTNMGNVNDLRVLTSLSGVANSYFSQIDASVWNDSLSTDSGGANKLSMTFSLASNTTYTFALLGGRNGAYGDYSLNFSGLSLVVDSSYISGTAYVGNDTTGTSFDETYSASGNLANSQTLVVWNYTTGSEIETVTLSATQGTFNAIAISAIPEPSAFGLLAGLGALALVGARRRRR